MAPFGVTIGGAFASAFNLKHRVSTFIRALLRNGALPTGSTNTNGSCYLPAWNGAGNPYALVEIDANEATLPGFRRATTVAEGARLGEDEMPNDFTDPKWILSGAVNPGALAFDTTAASAFPYIPLACRPGEEFKFTVTPINGPVLPQWAIFDVSNNAFILVPTSISFGEESQITVVAPVGCTNMRFYPGRKPLSEVGTFVFSRLEVKRTLPTWLNDDGLGNPLHPSDGNNLLAYPARQDSTAYAEGDIRWGSATTQAHIAATSGTVTTGAVVSGTVADTETNGGVEWVIGEVTGTPGFNVEFQFDNVTGDYLALSGYYEGNAAHVVQVQAWNTVTEGWDVLGTLVDAVTEEHTHYAITSQHKDGTNKVLARIYHVSPGNTSHTLHIDEFIAAGDVTYSTLYARALNDGTTGTDLDWVPADIGSNVWDGGVQWAVLGHYTPMAGVPSWPSTTNKVECDSVPTEVVGSELWPGTSVSLGAGWTNNGDGTYTCDGTQGAASNLTLNGAVLPTGGVFRSAFTLSGVTAGAIREILGGSLTAGWVSSDGLYSTDILNTATANSFLFQADANFVGTITPSTKLITNAPGTYSYHNGTSFVQNIPGMTLSGDTAAILSIVDGEDVSDVDWGDGTFRDLSELNAAGVVYKLDNSAGSTNANCVHAGSTGNTNTHSMMVVGRSAVGAVELRDSYGGSGWPTLPSAYTKTKSEGFTPLNTLTLVNIQCNAGEVAYFFLPHLIESSALPLPVIPTVAGSSTTLTATNPQVPTSPYLREQNCGVRLLVRPNKAGQGDTVLFASHVDSNNYMEIRTNSGASSLLLYQRIDGAAAFALIAYTQTAAPFWVDARWGTDGRGIRVKEVGDTWSAWGTHVNTDTLPLTATVALGNRAIAAHFDGSILAVQTVKGSNPKALLEALA